MGRDLDQFRHRDAGGRAARLPNWRAVGCRLARLALGGVFAMAAAPALAQDAGDMVFGALVLRWDPATWSVVERDSGFEASCLVQACKGRVVMGSVVTGGECEAPALERRHGGQESIVESGSLRWKVSTWWLGCRNAHPKSVAACAVHGGRAYSVSAPLLTCRTGPGYGAESAILSLVRGIRP